MRAATLIPAAALVLSLAAIPAIGQEAPAADDRGWLGVYTEAVEELPVIPEGVWGIELTEGARSGLRVTVVFPGSPAERAGLLEGDVIVAASGRPFHCVADSARAVFSSRLDGKKAGSPFPLLVIRDAIERSFATTGSAAIDEIETDRLFWTEPDRVVGALEPGEGLTAAASTERVVKLVPVVLGLRPEARWPAPRTNREIERGTHYPIAEQAGALWSLVGEFDVRRDTEDLLERLARCHAGSDPHRLETMIYVHRDPFRLEGVTRALVSDCAAPERSGDEGVAGALEEVAGLLDVATGVLVPMFEPARALPDSMAGRIPNAGGDVSVSDGPAAVERLLDGIEAALERAAGYHAMAFAALSDDDRAFLVEHRWDLSDAFAGETYIHFDEDRERFARNKRIIDLAGRVDHGALMECADVVTALASQAWTADAVALIAEAMGDSLDKALLAERETAFGRIIIAGTGPAWHREDGVAFLLDMGGDDFYTGSAGGATDWDVPVSVLIDVAGDDAYESTTTGCQGTGCLGVGALLDLTGDDEYIGIQWAQGCGYLGVGWLQDAGGDDVYRGRTFCQGVGLFGAGILLDVSGSDRYEGDCHVQACGLAGGFGLVADRAGDDEYYAKGLYPTGYGDDGIFDAWSQGCGMGFRTLASGGLGLLLDAGGTDRMEAGNFSQGGGYYYGMGVLAAGGTEDDLYIGSRYNQGFCAHQAVGVFLESGGDDRYTTRQGVAQGLAWDESVTLFLDESGDDSYDGGGFFSLGASAHNSVCFFIDRGGDDDYVYPPGVGRAGGNSYHGGTSLSLFVDEQGFQGTLVPDDAAAPDYSYHPEHGFVLDLNGSIQAFMSERYW